MEDAITGNLTQLLWTGGWDSTFRLLQLVFVQKCRVQPFYVIDPRRRSTQKELAAIEAIRQEVAARLAVQPICPVIYGEVREDEIGHELSSAYDRLNQLSPLGKQYLWLAQYAISSGLNKLETGVLAGEEDKTYPFISEALGSEQDRKLILGYFSFPLRGYSKTGIRKEAKEHGFLDILEMSWFCHSYRDYPCGTCGPCRDAIKAGLKYRIGARGLARHYAHAVMSKMRNGNR